MSNIFSSATKLVLLYVVLILGVLTLVAGIHSVLSGEYTEIAKAIFTLFGAVVTYVMGYYFGRKEEAQAPELTK